MHIDTNGQLYEYILFMTLEWSQNLCKDYADFTAPTCLIPMRFPWLDLYRAKHVDCLGWLLDEDIYFQWSLDDLDVQTNPPMGLHQLNGFSLSTIPKK